MFRSIITALISKKIQRGRVTTFLLLTIVLFITTLLILVFVYLVKTIDHTSPKISYGVSFSPYYTQYLGLEWKSTYLSILDDLKVKNFRIPTYWNKVEPEEGVFDFLDLDYMVSEVEKRQGFIVLVVGGKQPRWPECYYPQWVKELSVQKRSEKLLDFIKVIVERYKNNPVITHWQVENEPLFGFGEGCDPPNKVALQKEINLVRKLDPSRKIILTDTGEWSTWIDLMKMSDILGVSLYRYAYNNSFGYINYPLSPVLYNIKSRLIRQSVTSPNTKTIVVELQTEPWLSKGALETPLSIQYNLFTIENFEDTLEFAKRTSFDEIYFWGVEWWAYMKKNGYSQHWDFAKLIFE